MARTTQVAAVFIALVLVLSAAGYGIVRGIQERTQDDSYSAECRAYLDQLKWEAEHGIDGTRLAPFAVCG